MLWSAGTVADPRFSELYHVETYMEESCEVLNVLFEFSSREVIRDVSAISC